VWSWKKQKLEMWANAQRDGRPAEYRWCPLFNAAKFGWCPLLEYRVVMLPRCETRWNLLGYPKLTNGSEPLLGRSSPYYEDMWRRYWRLTCFFPIVDLIRALVAKIWPDKVVRWCQDGDFLCPIFSGGTCSTSQIRYTLFTLEGGEELTGSAVSMCGGSSCQWLTSMPGH